jgi:hypothetical protein
MQEEGADVKPTCFSSSSSEPADGNVRKMVEMSPIWFGSTGLEGLGGDDAPMTTDPAFLRMHQTKCKQ